MSVNFDTRPDEKATSDLFHRPTDECHRCGDEIVGIDRCKVALEDLTESTGSMISGNLCEVCWSEVFDVVCGKSID